MSRSTYFTPQKRSVEFLSRATNFYQNQKKIGLLTTHDKSQDSARAGSSPSASVEQAEKELIELYKGHQEDLGASLSLLAFYKKELELAVALKDQKIDRALLLEPPFRIALALYLEISPENLSEQHWIDADISPQTWTRILHFSESNDFRILLLEGKLSKEEIDKMVK